MKISKLASLEKTEVNMDGAKDVWRQTPISTAHGTPNFSFRVFTVAPNGHTPFHTHPFEHCNYIISGHGLLVQEDGQERAIETGDFALVLPNEKHQYKNASETEPFVMICAVPKEYE
jgi:quercetin dioxygenase-like cupin family protein